MARQREFRVELGAGAQRDLGALSADIQRVVLAEIARRLRTEPYREIKTRIKRLTGIIPPLYRLRVGDYRAYYRIREERVIVLAILHKKDSERWLKRVR
jgi:mRNA-degrading endonuclease RelE of RelBE toxin-antitoxin system